MGLGATGNANEDCVYAMLLMLGANEAIKNDPEPSIGSKVYYRVICQKARATFLALGGKIDDFSTPPTLTLPTRPELTFYETDIEAMRKLVAEFDRSAAAP